MKQNFLVDAGRTGGSRLTERIPRSVLIGGAVLAPFFLAFAAYSRPGYFTSESYLGGLLLLEFLFAAVWMYRQVFFPLVVLAFLLAGMGAPGDWTASRWLFLGVGAGVGCVIMLKEHSFHFGLFHVIGLFAVMTALVSAAVSRYPSIALLKALSLLLLFIYGSTGARLAVTGRESRFFTGLLVGCELFVAVIAAYYFVGLNKLGNPNSLGAVMGVVGAPILLWGILLDEKPLVRRRRMVLFAICLYLVFQSHARAGMAAAVFSCGLLCLLLRKFKLLMQGVSILLIVFAAAILFRPEKVLQVFSSLTTTVVYKSNDPTRSVLASRESPWQAAVETIRNNFWLGTGFGTTDNGKDASDHLGQFATAEDVASENGSSYLAIVTWVGMLGVVPFFFLLVAILGKIIRTVVWMWKTGNAIHPSVPIAMVLIAGLLHATFEDWLFAPGYYLCVFFWCLAFVLVDVAPPLSLQLAFARPSRAIPQTLRQIAPSR